ncbi:unnamed protein product [Lactuca saligna]|uniref:RRM domain-containing protein n=1 Tax=Lactuca saligna TaxID=75948 RepID=A0AA36EE17_LACSI|nr:unnamed protein product [Lactuca saligna]
MNRRGPANTIAPLASVVEALFSVFFCNCGRWRRRFERLLWLTPFPDYLVLHGSSKVEIEWMFQIHGDVKDIYMVTKKDSSRQNFAFVRFVGIADERRIEESLKGIRFKNITLIINKAKFDRKDPKSIVLNSRVCHPPPHPRPYWHHGGFRDNRTFTGVLARNGGSKCLLHQISINTEVMMKQWKNNELSLIGKAHNAKHLNIIPSTVNLGDDDSVKGEWFAWVDNVVNVNIEFERIIWVKIVGLPFDLWDESNINNIGSQFGEVVIPFEFFSAFRDFSMAKVCIMTKSLKKVNKEIAIPGGDRMVKIGIIEMNESWSPFKKQTSEDNWLDDLPESDEEDHLGVPKTDNQNEDDVLEEREIGMDIETRIVAKFVIQSPKNHLRPPVLP